MVEEFVKRIYKTIVDEGCEIYKDLYENTVITDRTTEYWKGALYLYDGLELDQKQIFNSIIKQTIIDTISMVFGVLDGSTTLTGGDLNINVIVEGVESDEELQDYFLQLVEEKEAN